MARAALLSLPGTYRPPPGSRPPLGAGEQAEAEVPGEGSCAQAGPAGPRGGPAAHSARWAVCLEQTLGSSSISVTGTTNVGHKCTLEPPEQPDLPLPSSPLPCCGAPSAAAGAVPEGRAAAGAGSLASGTR